MRQVTTGSLTKLLKRVSIRLTKNLYSIRRILWTNSSRYATWGGRVCDAGPTKANASNSKFKSENSDNDAVTDNVAAQAYVEQFGLEVFNRADNAVRANKASRYVCIRIPNRSSRTKTNRDSDKLQIPFKQQPRFSSSVKYGASSIQKLRPRSNLRNTTRYESQRLSRLGRTQICQIQLPKGRMRIRS